MFTCFNRTHEHDKRTDRHRIALRSKNVGIEAMSTMRDPIGPNMSRFWLIWYGQL